MKPILLTQFICAILAMLISVVYAVRMYASGSLFAAVCFTAIVFVVWQFLVRASWDEYKNEFE